MTPDTVPIAEFAMDVAVFKVPDAKEEALPMADEAIEPAFPIVEEAIEEAVPSPELATLPAA